MTTTNSWLPLTEYSNKHRVSISTLRRRIKAEDIRFRFEDGKYLILDEAPKKTAVNEQQHRPSLNSEVIMRSAETAKQFSQVKEQVNEVEIQQLATTPTAQNNETSESVLTAANKLLLDLKKAYTQVLQEKEEQIMYLKEEIIDQKTLIKILESENSRLRDQR
jgi:ABC-type uncharacterized transport system permease subunit